VYYTVVWYINYVQKLDWSPFPQTDFQQLRCRSGTRRRVYLWLFATFVLHYTFFSYSHNDTEDTMTRERREAETASPEGWTKKLEGGQRQFWLGASENKKKGAGEYPGP
jgi:hypothetical protein